MDIKIGSIVATSVFKDGIRVKDIRIINNETVLFLDTEVKLFNRVLAKNAKLLLNGLSKNDLNKPIFSLSDLWQIVGLSQDSIEDFYKLAKIKLNKSN